MFFFLMVFISDSLSVEIDIVITCIVSILLKSNFFSSKFSLELISIIYYYSIILVEMNECRKKIMANLSELQYAGSTGKFFLFWLAPGACFKPNYIVFLRIDTHNRFMWGFVGFL